MPMGPDREVCGVWDPNGAAWGTPYWFIASIAVRTCEGLNIFLRSLQIMKARETESGFEVRGVSTILNIYCSFEGICLTTVILAWPSAR